MNQPSLHDACFLGDLEGVSALLDGGADPNAPASEGHRAWVSCAGPHPRPLNCVAVARVVSERHVAIARLLLRRGALVDESVLADLDVEQVGTAPEAKLRELLDAASRGGC